MSLRIEDTIPLYISQKDYDDYLIKMNKNKTSTSYIYINQLSNDFEKEFDFYKYRLYKTLENIPRLYILMYYRHNNGKNAIASSLVKKTSRSYGSYFPLDENRVYKDEVSFLEIGAPDEKTFHIAINIYLSHIS